MSSGAFVRSKYQSSYDAAQIHPIRVQPETIAASIGGVANTAPSGATTSPISAKVSGTRRSIGLTARRVTIAAPATGQPTGYLPGGKTTIPALTGAFFNAAIKGAAVTYLGVATFTVVSRSSEVTG